MKKIALKNVAKFRENTCIEVSFLIKLHAQHKCLLVNFAKLLRTLFYTEHFFLCEKLLNACTYQVVDMTMFSRRFSYSFEQQPKVLLDAFLKKFLFLSMLFYERIFISRQNLLDELGKNKGGTFRCLYQNVTRHETINI